MTFPTPEPWVPGRVLTCSLNSLPLQASTPEARFREMVGLFKLSYQAMSKVHFKYILSDPCAQLEDSDLSQKAINICNLYKDRLVFAYILPF